MRKCTDLPLASEGACAPGWRSEGGLAPSGGLTGDSPYFPRGLRGNSPHFALLWNLKEDSSRLRA